LKAAKDENDGLKKKVEELSKPKDPPKEDPPKDEDDLDDKARKAREAKEKDGVKTKDLESALKFNLSATEFLKTNKDILPSDFEGMLVEAEKEKYDSAIEKANAVKSSMIKNFFAVQANLDLLTASHKVQIDDFLKLSKNGREEKAAAVFENIFEPAIEMVKKLKKAEELGKASSGYHSGNKVENAYKEKLMNVSKKTHLGEKGV
jgi:hypothetical protein